MIQPESAIQTDQCLALAKSNEFQVSVLTRDCNSAKSQALLSEFPNIKLLEGSYTTEEGLRTAFADQDVTYFNVDSFTVGEPFEYFWTFRAYEIAVQSGLKWFIYPGASPDRVSRYNYAERYRNSHNVTASRLTGWLTTQPLDTLPWTIITGGIYVEMLNTLLRPKPHGDGFAFMAPMDNDSIMPLIPLDNYGESIKWALQHPEKAIGKFVTARPIKVTYPQIAESVQRVSGKKTTFVPVSVDDWMKGISSYVNPENKLPRGARNDDPTSFTFRKSFGAWWNIWKDNRRESLVPDLVTWEESETGSTPMTLDDWMRSVEYDPAGPVRLRRDQ